MAIADSGLLISWATPAAKKADSRQALRADELLAPLVNLPIEVAADLLKAGRHAVEGFGQLLHFVLPREGQAIVEIALGHAQAPLDAAFAAERKPRYSRRQSSRKRRRPRGPADQDTSRKFL